jgi:glutamate synthase domain-containing protein 3
VNPALVEVEALFGEDSAYVAGLLQEHVDRTGSNKASTLLARWEESLGRLKKVVPIEYRRAMEVQAGSIPAPGLTTDPLPESDHRAPDAE